MNILIWEEYSAMWISYKSLGEDDSLKFFIVKKDGMYFPLIQRIRNHIVQCTSCPEPQLSLIDCQKQANDYVIRLLDQIQQ